MRERINFDKSWLFHKGDLAANDAPAFSTFKSGMRQGLTDCGVYHWREDGLFFESGTPQGLVRSDDWIEVDLPHDWALENHYSRDKTMNPHCELNGYIPKQIGYYRKEFSLSAEDAGKKISIEFDGVFRKSTVFLNGFYLGTYNCGYMGFRYDLSDMLRFGDEGDNVILVHVDPTEVEGWWYEGAGIYRHVWLVKTSPLHVARWGTMVTTPVITPNKAEVQIITEIENEYDEEKQTVLITGIIDPDGNMVSSVESEHLLEPLSVTKIEQKTIINSPMLWSVESPIVYKAFTEIKSANKIVDRYETPFGIRSIEFDNERGFFLNGKQTPIKGVCLHQDFAGVGVALTDRMNEYRVELLKEMGCNAIRTAHHPPTPELLDICDRLGVLVMCENRQFSTSPDHIENLVSMIKRDVNHPSVIMWSIENEEELESNIIGVRILKKLRNVVYRHDRTRPVVAALARDMMDEFGEELDIVGYNYGREKYFEEHGKPSEKCLLYNPHGDQQICEICVKQKTMPGYYEKCEVGKHFVKPKWKFIGSETTSCSAARGCYEFNPILGYASEYGMRASGNLPPDETWLHVLKYPWLTGIFVWTGFDYRGESYPMHWPTKMAQCGIMDLCGFPKDQYYWYKSAWTDEPVVHLMPHWNWPDEMIGRDINVRVYSNQDTVELFLNNISLGEVIVPESMRIEWKVNYQPGTLKAVAKREGKVTVEKLITTTGAPAKIILIPDREIINADGIDVSIVKVAVVDKEGNIVPQASNEIVFTVEDNGKIIGLGNGDPTSFESDKPLPISSSYGWLPILGQLDDRNAPDYSIKYRDYTKLGRRRAFNGLCMVIIQSDGSSGEITLRAESPTLSTSHVAITAELCEKA